MTQTKYVLVADDDRAVGSALSLLMRRTGMTAKTVTNPEDAIALVRESKPMVVVMDMNYGSATTGQEGLELLRKIKVLAPDVPVILITAWGSIDLAVKGMKLGAADFVTKPWRNEDMLNKINTAIELSTGSSNKGTNGEDDQFDRCGIVGESQALKDVLETVKRVAPTDASVLILGENGTGKELIARAIHNNSRRAGGPMVSVNLGGVPQTLFESEMFGYVKGAFTDARDSRKGRFEMADKGTIFLDEIGELDPMSQVKMLRVLQEHTFEPLGDSLPRRVDFRLVSATNADLAEMVADQRFREDLYYRINLITLKLPPLRERRDDIEPLTRYFLHKIAEERGLNEPELGRDAADMLYGMNFAGNIRELRNRVERAMVIYGQDNRILRAEHFKTDEPAARVTFHPSTLEDVERQKIMNVMNETGGNISRAAEILGLTRQALYRRLKKMRIEK